MCDAQSLNFPYFSSMRRAIALLLVFLWMYQQLGVVMGFYALRYQVKKEIKHRIKKGVPEEELITLSFSAQATWESQGVNWLEDDKEFFYQGSMYDVVERYFDDDSVIFRCVNDVQEAQLFRHLAYQVDSELFNQQSETGKKSQWLKQVMAWQFVLPSSIALAIYSTDWQYMPFEIASHYYPFLSLGNPPPEV
ncbi:hypothetical protein QWY31_05570 [Cytophagales bacterium LB-30]|uniref:DUF4105 domain-containing protein n=1 Tax=Shiella aurantiaca TaxID=3058365 RepID=A0ABT8F3H5_9BACT|nr:hypothetical protein [Shiella aurantiaca]MDN4164960.1 hypothetical protein [Shiella aurantiaca]